MEYVTDFFEGFEDYAEGITQEELEFGGFIVDTAIKLRKLREDAGFTQRKTAESYGCTPQMLSKIESGDCDIRVGTIWKYATALGYQVQITFVPKQEGK